MGIINCIKVNYNSVRLLSMPVTQDAGLECHNNYGLFPSEDMPIFMVADEPFTRA